MGGQMDGLVDEQRRRWVDWGLRRLRQVVLRQVGALLGSRRATGCSLIVICALVSCGDCDGAAETADEFVRDLENQRCETTADCVRVGGLGCAPTATAYCGSVGMSKAAAESTEWRQIQGELDACDDSCSVCGAALLATCSADGLCRRPDAPTAR